MSIVCNGEGNIAVQTIVDGVNENSARLDAWSAGVTYKVGSFIYNATDEFYYQALAENTGSQPVVGNTNWHRWSPVNYFEMDLIKTVGATGDYATLDVALASITRWISVDGAILTLEIEDGHVIDYNINTILNAADVKITYAGAGPLVIDANGWIATESRKGFFNISGTGEKLLFDGVDISLIGVINTSALTSSEYPLFIRGPIDFHNCTININTGVSTDVSFPIMLIENGSFSKTDVTVSGLSSPALNKITIIELLFADSWAEESNIDIGGFTIKTCLSLGYGGTYIGDIVLSNAQNSTYGIVITGGTYNISGGSFRRGVSDDAGDIHFASGVASCSATGGSNLQPGTMSTAGVRM